MLSPRPSRVHLLLLAAALFGLTAFLLATDHWADLAYHAIADGLPLAAWMIGAWGLGSFALSGIRFDPDERPLREVSAVAIGLGTFSLVTLGLGVIGALAQPSAIALLAVGLATAVRRIRTDRKTIAAWLRDRPAGATWLLTLVAVPTAVAAVGALILPGVLWGADDPAGYDVVAYHLQLPREWFELGRVTTLRHNVFSFFPLNVEMQYLLAMHLRSIGGGGPFAGMYLAQLMHGTYIGLTVAAVWAIARPRGAFAASVAAIVCAFVPWLPMLGSVAYNEGGLMLYTTLAAGWAIRGPRVIHWAIAGACAGLAAGCKPTGLVAACVLVPLAAAALRPLRPTGGRAVRRGLVTFGLLAIVTLSPWLIRTAIGSGGNPIFPLALSVLGQGGFDDGQVERFVVAHAPRPDQHSVAGRLAALRDQILLDWHYGVERIAGVALALWTLPIAAGLIVGWRSRETYLWVGLIVGNLLVWLFATHLQGRFAVHAIPFVGLLAACAMPRPGPDNQRGLCSPHTAYVALGLALASAAISACLTWPRLARTIGSATVAMGLPDPSPLNAIQLERAYDAAYKTDHPIYLVGDAKAFLYAIPMTRLHYRSVFDVLSTGPLGFAWTGGPVPDEAWVLIDASELARFERTYRRLPPLPQAWRDGAPPIVDGRTWNRMNASEAPRAGDAAAEPSTP